MKIKIQNETTYPSREVATLVRWVIRYLELGETATLIKVKHHAKSHAYQGRFYHNPHNSGGYIYDFDTCDWKEVAPKVPRDMKHLIVCRIGKPGVYPTMNHVYKRKNGPQPWMVETWQEALICIMAHEAFHLRQYTVEAARNHGRYNEVDTEWAAFRLLGEWRAEQ